MFDKIIAYSIKNKPVIGLFVAALALWGIYSLRELPVDAVPDITNNQIQVITISPTLATQEVEQFITTPVELALQNVQQLVEIRSISRFGLSVVTVVFEEDMDVYLSRQLVNENLKEAEENIPQGLGIPELAPISTGLGEIYQYVLRTEEGYENKYPLTELRSMQDWIVSRQLSGIEGVVEVNTTGGFLKQYEVAIDPDYLKSLGITIAEIFDALENSNENTGGAYIEKNPNTYYIRTNGIVRSLSDIENIVVNNHGGRAILIKDLAKVQYGKAPRYGALVRGGEEAVGGRVMMLKGANSAMVTERIKERVVQIQKSLPEGVIIEPYLVRDKLVSTAISTVKTNLLEGGLIVIFILVLMLGNWRAGLIVASVIPLAMLFAVSMMRVFGISANLMSLGAIDFGLIVDGAVIIVEAIIHRLQVGFAGKKMTQTQMNTEVQIASTNIRSSAAFGEIIILMVYIPILALVGIEGKMFKPMAQTVMLAIGGALILSLTYVPMMTALFLKKDISDKKTIADRIINFFQRIYTPILNVALRLKTLFVLATILLFVASIFVFSRMGGEFIPTLEEGDLAMQQILPPGTSLAQSVETAGMIQRKLLDEFPEIKPKEEWTSARNRKGMFAEIEKSLHSIPGVGLEFSQPIQLRFNELMTGSKADIAIKLYGDDLDLIYNKAKEAERIITRIEGVGTVNVEQTIGMPQIIINFKYDRMAQYGLQVKDVNQVVRSAFAGEKAGVVYEGEKRFDLVVRLQEKYRSDIKDVQELYIPLENGTQIPLAAVADVELTDAPMQISRESTNRRIVIGVNVGDTDVETLVEKIQQKLDAKVELPTGYYFTYGGQFENLKAANERLLVAVPLALALIFIMLYFTFNSAAQAALIFTAIPLSAIGGVFALQLRGMPFSISAGIGFIALFGVAVLNGIVLIGYLNQLKKEGVTDIRERILLGTRVRLRPVLMTASVASLGFLPMALSTSGGAEVQQPLATVVIGGLLTATFLTLIVLPILYDWLANWQEEKRGSIGMNAKTIALLFPLFFTGSLIAQVDSVSLEEAMNIAVKNHPSMTAADLQIQQSQVLQNIAYSLGDTEIEYQGNGLFRENGQRVNQLGLIQSIPNPASIKAYNNLQLKLTQSMNLQKNLTESELRLQVQQLYINLQHRKSLREQYVKTVDLYKEYLRKATVKVKVGAANNLEKMTLEAKYREYQMLLRQVEIEVVGLENELQVLLHSNEKLTSSDELKLQGTPTENTSQNTILQIAEQNISIEKANVHLLEALRKPDFKLGYSAQNYFEDGWLNGLQAGMKVPLFNKQNKQKIEAQQLKVEFATAQYSVKKSNLQQRKLDLKNKIDLYQEGANYYQKQLNTLNPELERLAELNYQAGEISYLELLNILSLTADNNCKYLEQVAMHNQALARYSYLLNQ